MHLNSETIEIQHKLSEYCRTGRYVKINGVNKERASHYRRLVLGNVKNTLERAYPITLEWLNEDEWLKLVDEFFEKHDCQTPKIWELPEEFMDFVVQANYAHKFNKPALNDLLLIEWVEIEVHTAMEKVTLAYQKDVNLLFDKIVLTPEYSLLKLEYPVHALNADEAASKKGEWFIFVFRNRETDSVQFLNISPLHVFVIEKLYEQPQSMESLLPLISSVFGLTDFEPLKVHLQSFLSDLHKKGALLGGLV
ncbi:MULTISPECIES: HvfC/BufC N-terminal domain-containing protein [unclassified Saccharicrinis]|uniref:HvfC/BufC N-terminal domain-containing protein n=1 Tax=unclassified Saccharicrinis TaxID=2646859 RepID=UPI003D326CD8